MKKTNRFLACLMACLLALSLGMFTTGAKALCSELAVVFVDGKEVSGITAYLDSNGDIKVSSNEMYKIFPSEMENVLFLPTEDGIIVKDWVDYLGYSSVQDGTLLYIYTNGVVPPSNEDINWTPPHQGVAQVFMNGMRIFTINTYISNGKVYVNNYNDLRLLFPNASRNIPLPASLEALSSNYKYSYVVNENRVYLNNDGNSPVEVQLNGETVSFADQQPVVFRPGRTMVPIRALSELVGCSVEWDASVNRICISKDHTTLVLWLNNTKYWLNGTYYEMDVMPQAVNNRTLVPIRFISEAFGYSVAYESDGTVGVVKLSS